MQYYMPLPKAKIKTGDIIVDTTTKNRYKVVSITKNWVRLNPIDSNKSGFFIPRVHYENFKYVKEFKNEKVY